MGAAKMLQYLGVARVSDGTVLAEYASTKNSELEHRKRMLRVLATGSAANYNRMTVKDDIGDVHFYSDTVLLFVAISTVEYPQMVAFKLLGECRERFKRKFRYEIGSAAELSLEQASRPMFEDIMNSYEQHEVSVSKVGAVQQQVEEVKGQMQVNIQTALKNSDHLETLFDSTQVMKNEASNFQNKSQEANQRMRWKNLKMKLGIFVLLIVLAVVIAVPFVLQRQSGGAQT